ncbi:MAG TPA: InlB B-repeat-containing protein, partial [Clostridiales bacterium]|nr:InlB B-repeat-containing protein [Clostridiales bacterium]
MRQIRKLLSVLMVTALVLASVGMGVGSSAQEAAQPQALTPFSTSAFRRPAPDVTLDVTDVTRVGAAGDDTMGSGNTIKKATQSGVPYVTGTYGSQALAGETPYWPTISFASSVAVSNVTVTLTGTGVSASATLVSGSTTNTTAAVWEIQGGTATAGSVIRVAVQYTYTWNNPYTGVAVTDTYTTYGFSYVENIIFPAGVWAFASAYTQVANAADVQYVSRFLGKGVYGNTIGREANAGNEYSSGYFNFASNSHNDDGDTTVPRKTMLIADPAHLAWGDQYLANGTGTYGGGDTDRAKATVYLDTSVQTLQENNFRIHFFIHGTMRSTDTNRDLTYETIHVRQGDAAYSGGTGNVLGTSNSVALSALNPSGPVDGTTSTGGGFITAGMQTASTLYGSGAAGTYTVITQWTARGDKPGTLDPNWMQYYHGVTVDIVNVNKGSLRSLLNTCNGVTTKAFAGSDNVTTIVTANGADPASGGIDNTNKGKNPQSWYFASGWTLFNSYSEAAWTQLTKPNAPQTAVDTAATNLTGAHASLVLRSANYSDGTSQTVVSGLGNTYYGSQISPLDILITACNTADASFNPKLAHWKTGTYSYYTEGSRAALDEAYAAATAAKSYNYNVIYQPYVDYCAQQLQLAIQNLAFNQNTVTFDGNGATTGSMAAQTIASGATAALTINGFSRIGYTFGGWAATAGGAAEYPDGGNYTMGAVSVTLYAKWIPITYTVAYNGNGATSGTTVSSTHTYDVARALNNNGFSRSGYSFLGWSATAGATSPTYINQQSVMNLTSTAGATITLYAVWSANVYNIVFNPNGGSGTMANQGIVYLQSASLSLNTYTLTGRTFIGWATSQENADAGTVAYTNGATYTMTTPESKILYAVWSANSYNLNFNANAPGVTGSMPPQLMLFGQVYALNSNTFSRTGYRFAGWATTSGGAKAYDDGANYTMNSEGATLYAKWDANAYTVVYNANGGSSAPAPTAALYGTAFDLSTDLPVRAGYSFAGWANSAGAVSPDYTAGQSVSNLTAVNGGTVILYAVWTPNTDTPYNVNHYLETATGTYELFETTTQTGTTGQTGNGTYKTYANFASNPSHPSTVASGIIAGNGSLTLMLFYDRVFYTISFNTAGGSSISPISGKFGTAYTPPPNPTRPGYQFAGWTPELPPVIPTGNLSVTATWTAQTYQVVFNGNGATGGSMAPQNIAYLSTAALTPNVFVRTGYSFAGWATSAGGGVVYADGANYTMNAMGATLYAVWSPSAATFTVQHYLQDIGAQTYSLGLSTTQSGTTGQVGIAQWETIAGFTANYGYAGNVTAGVIEGGGGLVLKLHYTRNSYTLSFSGADGMAPINAQFGQEIAQPAAPDKPGFNFAGWYLDEGLTQPVVWPYTMGTANKTLYAKWVLGTYTVAFDPAGGKINGTTGIKYSTVTYAATYAEGTLGFPTPEKTGYTFAGWFD